MNLFESFWPLMVAPVLIAIIIAAIVAWRRRDRLEAEPAAEGAMGGVQRLYFYVATFAYLLVAGNGIVLVARYLLDELFGPERLTRDVTELALGVALALIWTPVWVWHRLRVQRLLAEEPAERGDALRKMSIYLTLGVSAALAMHASVELLRWVFGARSFTGYPIAALAVWSGVWVYHWLAEEREGQPSEEARTIRRLYVYWTSGYALSMLAAGAAIALYLVFREAYEGLVDIPRLLRGEEGLWRDRMKDALAIGMVGSAIWAYHWLSVARRDVESDLRQFYLFVFAILGGFVTALASTGVLTFGVLQWAIGTPEQDAVSAHFRFLPGTVASIIVGLGLWVYHWDTARREQAAYGRLAEVTRINGYVMSALGLGAIAGAVAVLVPTVIGIAVSSAREVLAGEDWWRDRIAVVLTLAILGAPVWGYYWSSMQRRAEAGGAEERAALPRRLLVYGVAAAGTLAALGSVSYLLFAFLDAALENELSPAFLRDAKWSMGALVTAALIAPYYWFVLQEDRRALAKAAPPPGAAPRKAVTLLIADGSAPFVRQLEGVLKGKVRVLQRTDPGAGLPQLSGEDLERLERRIAEAPGTRVLLVADASGVQVYPYR